MLETMVFRVRQVLTHEAQTSNHVSTYTLMYMSFRDKCLTHWWLATVLTPQVLPLLQTAYQRLWNTLFTMAPMLLSLTNCWRWVFPSIREMLIGISEHLSNLNPHLLWLKPKQAQRNECLSRLDNNQIAVRLNGNWAKQVSKYGLIPNRNLY